MNRKPLFLISTEGKSPEQISQEAWEAVLRYRKAKARSEKFEPTLDLKPEEEQ